MIGPGPPEAPRPIVVVLEGALWTPGAEWRLAVEHLAGRFRRVAELDVDAALAAGDIAAQVVALEVWAAASGASIDLGAELARYLDQHLSMHVRPDAAHTRALRAAASLRQLHGASALPEAAAASIARHAGLLRPLASLTGSVRTAEAHTVLRERLGAAQTITSLDELAAARA